jgi:orotidine-5'-phosphate decarboxylase
VTASLPPHRRILVALDTAERSELRRLELALRGRVGGFKIGLEAFSSFGPDPVSETIARGSEVFLDLKLHDIPNTVAGAAAAAARLGVTYLTVHALGGEAMMRRAVRASRDAAAAAGSPSPRVLAVTVLTSHSDSELECLGIAGPCTDAVVRLAAVARSAGVDGIVCSPLEIRSVRETYPEALVVVPGVRPAGTALGDQTRVATPSSAVAAGADRLVIGRPITKADDPRHAVEAIADEIRRGD